MNSRMQAIEVPKHKKNKFSKEEDKKLMAIVDKLGAKRWKVIASFIEGRSARQCRDRYTNYLKPDLVFDRWTPEEDSLLIQKYTELGPKWSTICKFFHGRSSSSLKNRWHSNLVEKMSSTQRKNEPRGKFAQNQQILNKSEAEKINNDIELIKWDDDILFYFEDENNYPKLWYDKIDQN